MKDENVDKDLYTSLVSEGSQRITNVWRKYLTENNDSFFVMSLGSSSRRDHSFLHGNQFWNPHIKKNLLGDGQKYIFT